MTAVTFHRVSTVWIFLDILAPPVAENSRSTSTETLDLL